MPARRYTSKRSLFGRGGNDMDVSTIGGAGQFNPYDLPSLVATGTVDAAVPAASAAAVAANAVTYTPSEALANLAASNEEALLMAAPVGSGGSAPGADLMALAVRQGTYDQSGVMASLLAGANPLAMAPPVLAAASITPAEELVHDVATIGTNVDTLV